MDGINNDLKMLRISANLVMMGNIWSAKIILVKIMRKMHQNECLVDYNCLLFFICLCFFQHVKKNKKIVQ